MGKVLQFKKKLPEPERFTPIEVKEMEQGALAAIDAKQGVGLVTSAYSKAELDAFIAELDAMEDEEL